jgi:aminoglycoside/choline kinase family phosphotransferase
MESVQELKMIVINDKRKDAIEHWLSHSCAIQPVLLQPMVGDASFRRYFRLVAQEKSLVVMDAPPPQENVRSYSAISMALRQMGVQTPEIIAADLEQGFLLITDFGDATYLKTLTLDNADLLYQRAMHTLSIIQSCKTVPNHTMPFFNTDFMLKEWGWHKEWVLDKWLDISLSSQVEKKLDECYALIVESAINQPQVFMHRDFHSANLMVTNEEVGVLDFQDAFIGPVTYDLVSLLRDCYIDWPQEKVNAWALAYSRILHERGLLTNVDDQTFIRWFDLMGIQRHLKALLTFARKHVRDHQSRYLQYVPRTLMYLLTVSERYPELHCLHDYLISVQVKQ